MLNGFFIPADANSVNVTPPQDTPMSNRKDGKYINFDIDVEIQKPIEKLPRGKKMISCDRYRGEGGVWEAHTPPPPGHVIFLRKSLVCIIQVDRATFERKTVVY